MMSADDLAGRQRQQAKMRLAVMTVIGIWIGGMHWAGLLPQGAWEKLLAVYSVIIPAALLFIYWAVKWPSGGWDRRLAGIVLDYGSLSLAIIFGGEALVPAIAALVWVTVGNGLRHGRPTLLAASAAALAAMAAIAYFNEYWRAQPMAALAMASVALLVPIYIFSMLRRLEVAYEAAQEANRSKSRFLAQASHDLRQPIHAISLFTSCLRDAGLAPRELEMVDNIDRSLESVSRLFKSLLDVSTLDSGRVTPTVEAVALQDVLDDVVQQNSAAAQRAGVELRAVRTSVWSETDRSLLATMLQNVVNNAIKYAPAGPVLIGVRRRGQTVSIEVFDRGPGISAENLTLVFDEFYQVRERGDRDVEGVGLGLPIVRRVGELLGLAVDLQSEQGKGTRVALRGLRMVPARPIRQERRAAAVSVGGSAMDGLRVLLVEDDEAVLLATASLLQSWGCEVRASTTIPEICEECDLLITDYDLGGGVTGKDCIEKVRELHGWELPAVVSSGHDAERVREELGDPEIPLLSKPVRPAELRSVVLASAVELQD